MKIIIASDHAGYNLRMKIVQTLRLSGPGNSIKVIDLGAHSFAPSNYPEYADKLCKQIKEDSTIDFGILICGSGIGMSMVANRHEHIRCALCRSSYDAKLSREHNNANVLVLGSRLISCEEAIKCLIMFFNSKFEGNRHQARLDKFNNVKM